jgi:hypothetical protein
MRHDHFLSLFAQQSAHPVRVHPVFQGDAAARHASEHLSIAVAVVPLSVPLLFLLLPVPQHSSGLTFSMAFSSSTET